METSTESYIYAIKSEQLQIVKIGFSTDPDARLNQLTQQSPVELVFVAIWKGGLVEEKEIHSRLTDFRKRGEWFALSGHQAIEKVSAILGHRPIWRPEQSIFNTAMVQRAEDESSLIRPEIEDFIASHLEIHIGEGVQLKQLFEIYMSWASERDITPVSIRGFASSLRQRGLIVKPTGRQNMVTVLGRRLISGACSGLLVNAYGRNGQTPDEKNLRPEFCPED